VWPSFGGVLVAVSLMTLLIERWATRW